MLSHYSADIFSSVILGKLGIKEKEFVLVTAHRAENVDDVDSLSNIVQAINKISEQFKVIVSVHPRTKDKLNKYDLKVADNVILSSPFGFFDFVKLEDAAKIVISDSGTVQEECCILGTPSITIRRSTERQETIECGSNVLSGTNSDAILDAFNIMIKRDNTWDIPADYLVNNVSDIVINILLGR